MRLAIAYLPVLGVFLHSFCHNLVMAPLDLHLALDLVVLKGIWHPSEVASFARELALSLPGMPQWLGHQDIVIQRLGCVSRRGHIRLWKLSVKYWADPGFGSMIALTAAALSEKNMILLMLGKSVVRLDAI